MARSYHHVTRDQRSQIQALKARGISLRSIAKQLGVDASTISREIRRNKGKRGYRVKQADKKARERRSKASRKSKKLSTSLRQRVIKLIEKKWSPEQISGRLKQEGFFISYETIYKMVRADKKAGGELYKQLRHRGKAYKRRLNGKKAGRGCIPNRIDISERPRIVEEKSRIGDFEVDTIIGANNEGAIFSMVDRHSKFLILELLEGKHAAGILAAFEKRVKGLPVHTMTFDNGKEFALHQQISTMLEASCYFATPYHSWERGLNEHSNGLVRQYLPKKTNFKEISREELSDIENEINNRARKVLGYKTPYEVFYQQVDPKRVIV